MKAKNNKQEVDYNTWKLNKINEIREAHACSLAEATIIFLLQDISYKLSKYYEK